jgi:hypothetical protein
VTRRLLPLAIVGAVAIALVATAAWAAIPDANGTIHACYKRDGALRVIDSATQTCTSRETPLQLAAAPVPASLPRSFVSRRNDDAQVFAGFNNPLLTLDLDPGVYQVIAKFNLSSLDPANSRLVGCVLDPSNPDGTPGDDQGPDSDQTAAHIAPQGQPGEIVSVTMAVSQTLTQPGLVALRCTADASPGAMSSFASIRAVEVGSVETEEEPVPLP